MCIRDRGRRRRIPDPSRTVPGACAHRSRGPRSRSAGTPERDRRAARRHTASTLAERSPLPPGLGIPGDTILSRNRGLSSAQRPPDDGVSQDVASTRVQGATRSGRQRRGSVRSQFTVPLQGEAGGSSGEPQGGRSAGRDIVLPKRWGARDSLAAHPRILGQDDPSGVDCPAARAAAGDRVPRVRGRRTSGPLRIPGSGEPPPHRIPGRLRDAPPGAPPSGRRAALRHARVAGRQRPLQRR